MGVKLDDEEAWAFLERGHTGILTTLRADGWPVSLPVWYVVEGGAVYVRTPTRSKKVARVAQDGRVSFLVEGGLAWRELTAVVVTGRAELLDDDPTGERIGRMLRSKYEEYRMSTEGLPDATRRHYSVPQSVIRIVPTEPLITWDNRKIRPRGGEADRGDAPAGSVGGSAGGSAI